MNPAERAKAIAQAARDAEDGLARLPIVSQLTDKSADAPAEIPQTPRTHWTVYRWGEEPVAVTLTEPLTQRQMRDLYPNAAGIIAP